MVRALLRRRLQRAPCVEFRGMLKEEKSALQEHRLHPPTATDSLACSYFCADSTARATRNAVPSFICEASTCMPTGSPDFVAPQGTVTPQMPARLAVTVYTSARYMARGSPVFSPSLNAGTGDVGVTIASTSANARRNSS